MPCTSRRRKALKIESPTRILGCPIVYRPNVFFSCFSFDHVAFMRGLGAIMWSSFKMPRPDSYMSTHSSILPSKYIPIYVPFRLHICGRVSVYLSTKFVMTT